MAIYGAHRIGQQWQGLEVSVISNYAADAPAELESWRLFSFNSPPISPATEMRAKTRTSRRKTC
jgi:hypothetical protein